MAKTLREGHRCRKRVFDGLRCTIHQRRVENARQYGVDADAFAHQIAGYRQGHANNAALGCGISRLAHLTVFSRNRRGVDHRTTFTIFHRLQCQHARCRLGDASERANQVNLNDAVKGIEREMLNRTVFLRTAGGLGSVARSSAVHQDTFLAMRRACLGKTGVNAFVASNVDIAKHAANLNGNGFTLIGLQVENRDLHALCSERPCSRFAKARCAASNDGCDC